MEDFEELKIDGPLEPGDMQKETENLAKEMSGGSYKDETLFRVWGRNAGGWVPLLASEGVLMKLAPMELIEWHNALLLRYLAASEGQLEL